jgi:hypothetical protein
MLNLNLAIAIVVVMAAALIWVTFARSRGWDVRLDALVRRVRGKKPRGARRKVYFIRER